MNWAVPTRAEDRFIGSPRGTKYHVANGGHVHEGIKVTARCGRKIKIHTYEGVYRQVVPAHVCSDCLEYVRETDVDLDAESTS